MYVCISISPVVDLNPSTLSRDRLEPVRVTSSAWRSRKPFLLTLPVSFKGQVFLVLFF